MKRESWTILELIDWSRQYLAGKGIANARLESELLLGHALSMPRIELYLNHERLVSQGELARYKALLLRRVAGEPVQYVTGTAGFMFSEFEVTPAVLIPRPETEALTEVALRLLEEMSGASDGGDSGGAGRIVADIGTGSGVIAVTIAQKQPDARVLATDASVDALAVARRNAERAGIAGRIAFLEGELLEPLRAAGVQGRVSMIVSNPPYVPTGEIDGLPAEVREFEPREALDGGPDGLDCLRAIAQDGPSFLRAGGVLAVEVGDGQAGVVAELMSEALTDVEVHKDYAGRDRIVTGRRGQ